MGKHQLFSNIPPKELIIAQFIIYEVEVHNFYQSLNINKINI